MYEKCWLDEVVEKARAGDEEAKKILDAWASSSPRDLGWSDFPF